MCANPQKTADLVTFPEEILNGKLHFRVFVLSKIKHYGRNVMLKGDLEKGSPC